MSVNKVILVGRLGKDPETRYMTNGEAVTNAAMATSENWKDKSGEKQQKTEWHNLVFYRKLSEIAGEYLKKGSQLYVEGKLQTRKWEKDGVTRYTTEIIVNEMTMLGGKQDQRADANSELSYKATPDKPPSQSVSSGMGNFDDDIPFSYHGMRGADVDWRVM